MPRAAVIDCSCADVFARGQRFQDLRESLVYVVDDVVQNQRIIEPSACPELDRFGADVYILLVVCIAASFD